MPDCEHAFGRITVDSWFGQSVGHPTGCSRVKDKFGTPQTTQSDLGDEKEDIAKQDSVCAYGGGELIIYIIHWAYSLHRGNQLMHVILQHKSGITAKRSYYPNCF